MSKGNYDLQKVANLTIAKIDMLKAQLNILFPTTEYSGQHAYKEALHNIRHAVQVRLNDLITEAEWSN